MSVEGLAQTTGRNCSCNCCTPHYTRNSGSHFDLDNNNRSGTIDYDRFDSTTAHYNNPKQAVGITNFGFK